MLSVGWQPVHMRTGSAWDKKVSGTSWWWWEGLHECPEWLTDLELVHLVLLE